MEATIILIVFQSQNLLHGVDLMAAHLHPEVAEILGLPADDNIGIVFEIYYVTLPLASLVQVNVLVGRNVGKHNGNVRLELAHGRLDPELPHNEPVVIGSKIVANVNNEATAPHIDIHSAFSFNPLHAPHSSGPFGFVKCILSSVRKKRQIKIAGKKFRINYIDMEDCWGECDIDNLTINLNKDCLKDDELYRTTLLHECIHAVLNLSGASYSCLDGDAEKEEGIVRAIESLFLPILDQLK